MSVPHSSTPWRVESSPVDGLILVAMDDDFPNGRRVCRPLYDLGSEDVELVSANTFFIMKAVNFHDDLVRALKELVERVDRNGGLGAYKGGPIFVMKRARELLKKVEGMK